MCLCVHNGSSHHDDDEADADYHTATARTRTTTTITLTIESTRSHFSIKNIERRRRRYRNRTSNWIMIFSQDRRMCVLTLCGYKSECAKQKKNKKTTTTTKMKMKKKKAKSKTRKHSQEKKDFVTISQCRARHQNTQHIQKVRASNVRIWECESICVRFSFQVRWFAWVGISLTTNHIQSIRHRAQTRRHSHAIRREYVNRRNARNSSLKLCYFFFVLVFFF